MVEICPTVLAPTYEEYIKQLDKIKPFAKRVQVDISDGHFAPSKTVKLSEIDWPDDLRIDLHMMVNDPGQYLYQIIERKPSLVIFHAEAKDSANFGLARVFEQIKLLGIDIGLALLPETSVKSQQDLLEMVDHMLIFSGKLGSFGGEADTSLLIKASEAKVINPALEIGWDGGINDKNIATLVAGGVNVLNVGGFIQNSDNPEQAYAILKEKINLSSA